MPETKTTRTTCPLCEALCGIQVEVTDGEVTGVRGDPEDPLSRGYICPKAAALPDLYTDPDRLRAPMVRDGGGWREASWDEALDRAAAGLAAAQTEHGRNALAIYLGNPNVHHYDATLAVPLLSKAMPTRNRYSATSGDQLPHMFVQWAMFGHQLLFPVPDLDRAEHLVVLGANPAASNGSIMTAPGAMRRLKAIRERGGSVIVIDPRRTRTAAAADRYLPIRPGTDAALLLAILHVLFAQDRIDDGAWRAWTDGLDALRDAATPFPPERVAGATGIGAETIRELALGLADAPSAALYARMGACTQRFGGLSLWLAYAINVVTGNLDRPGGMMFPQPAFDLAANGARMGQVGHYAAWRSREAGLPEFGGELPISAMASEMETPGDRQIRALLTIAGNPALSTPDGPRMERALAGLEFVVCVDIYLNETTRHADVILPPVSPLQRDHYGLVFHALAVRDTARWGEPALPAGPDGRTEWSILMDLCARVLRKKGGVRAKAKAAAFATALRLGPRPLLDLGLRTGPHKLSIQQLRENPAGIDLGPLKPCLPGRLYTPDARLRLAPQILLDDLGRLASALDAGELAPGDRLLLIGRRALRSNNSWMHNSRRLTKGKPRCTLLVHPDDADRLGLRDGGQAVVRSRSGELVAPVQIDDGVMPGVVSLPHGWGHSRQGARLQVAAERPGVSVNDVTDPAWVDALTGNAGFNGVPVEVGPA